jgi:cysteine desulfurase/selenocysteine lyase
MNHYPFDVQRLRKDFPMLDKTMHGKPLIYFDSAATAQKPHAVIEAITSFYRDHYGTVHRAVYQLAAESSANYEKVRQKIQSFLNAQQVEEIIFTRGTTESINLVAFSFSQAFVKPGDEILISALEHHSNIVPWQMICEQAGARLKVIPMNEKGELSLEEYEKLLSHRTRLVAVNHISNALGTVNPIKQMAAMAHAAGAYILVDGAQSAPHQKIDVQELDADFFVFSGHKAMGPTGIGVLYGKAALLNAMPPYQGGGDMIEKVTFEKTTYNKLPLKFEAGTPMIAEVIGLGAAIDYLQAIGLDTIHRWEQQLLNHATEKLQDIPGIRFIGQAKQKGAIISFTIDGIHALDLGTFLDLKGIAIRTGHHCAQPVMDFFHVPSTARASFAFYNTLEEIDAFVQALRDAVNVLKTR